MATTRKSTGKPARRTAKKDGSRLHAVKAIRETRHSLMETAKEYNEKYLVRPFESGMNLVGDLQKDPIKTAERLMDRGKEILEDVAKDPRRVFEDIAEEGRGFVKELREDLRRGVDNLMDGGRAVYNGLGKDAVKGYEGIVDKAKAVADRLPVVSSLEQGISRGLGSIPDRLNLPNKKDMEALAKTVRTLNRKINALSRAQAA